MFERCAKYRILGEAIGTGADARGLCDLFVLSNNHADLDIGIIRARDAPASPMN